MATAWLGTIVAADPAQRLLGRDDPLLVRLVDGERAHLQAPERRAVAPERLGDRPHVRPRANVEVEPDGVVPILDDVERVDSRTPQRHLDGDAPAVEAVGALAADLDRRGGRDRQLDLAAEALEHQL